MIVLRVMILLKLSDHAPVLVASSILEACIWWQLQSHPDVVLPKAIFLRVAA
jgi:hypothetical protein